ncbi:MAG: carboxypeptidase-like regulatory domain-containing protein [Nanoarchaeota archaeon]
MLTNFILSTILSFSLMFTPNDNTIGIITDSKTNEPLTGVKIVTDYETLYTDFDGKFQLKNISDSLEVNISYISYESVNFIITKENDDILLVNLKK